MSYLPIEFELVGIYIGAKVGTDDLVHILG